MGMVLKTLQKEFLLLDRKMSKLRMNIYNEYLKENKDFNKINEWSNMNSSLQKESDKIISRIRSIKGNE